MTKGILISGVLGGVVMFVVVLACQVFLPGVGKPVLQAMPGSQVQIHSALKQRITKPGTYVCPYLPENERSTIFPDYLNEPVFLVTYKGHTHATVPGFASVGILAFLLAPITASWLLSQASSRVSATFFRRAVYVAALGLFASLSADLMRALTEDLSVPAVAGMMLVSLITWILAGLVLAWRIKPKTASL